MRRERLYSISTDKHDEIIVLCSTRDDLDEWIAEYDLIHEDESDQVRSIILLTDDWINCEDPDLNSLAIDVTL